MTNHLGGGPQSTLLNPKDDSTTQEGAGRIAARIKAYWNRLGKFPQVWVERADQGTDLSGLPLYVVRSDMVGGRPQ